MKRVVNYLILAIALIIIAYFVSFVYADANAASLMFTDAFSNEQNDFLPGEDVYIYGSNFNPSSAINIGITRPDEEVESCSGSSCHAKFNDGLQYSDSNGNFLYRYDLDGIVGIYLVQVNDGINFAEATFTDDAGKPGLINATYNSQTGMLNVSGNYTDAPCSSTKRVGFAIFINGSNPVTPNGSKSLDGNNTNTMHLINPTSCQTNGTWRDNYTIWAAPSSVCVVIYDIATNKIGTSSGNNDIPAGSNRNNDNSYEENDDSYGFKVKDGELDLNKDGDANNADDGFFLGVKIINGEVDINNDNVVNNSDDSPPLFNGYTVKDAKIDINNDGSANNADDGFFANDLATCTSPSILGFCGNSIVDAGEQCDDGNANNNDACKNDCTNNICGDSFVETGVEACDDGNQNNNDLCSNSCTLTVCGDSFTQSPNGAGAGGPSNDGFEDCDDGNADNTDACLNSCTDATCGDGFIWFGIEVCETDSDCNDQNPFTVDTCSQCDCSNVDPVLCGDGNVDSGEQCDPPGSGCASGQNQGTCTFDCQCNKQNCENCGDGTCDGANGENKQTCPTDCQTAVCGNFACEGGENALSCPTDCAGVCGNGACTPPGENSNNCPSDCGPNCGNGNCDRGETSAACPADCCGAAAICGNGALEGIEECDDNNLIDGDGCDANCINEICGDGIAQGGEQCDDGNTDNGDGCNRTCLFEYPLGGTDCYLLNATMGLEFFAPHFLNNGNDSIKVNGPGIIKRKNSTLSPDNFTTIDTEIIQMELTGFSSLAGTLKVKTTGPGNSTGKLNQSNKTLQFPLNSFFDVYYQIELPNLSKKLNNSQPLKLEGNISSIPFAPSDSWQSTNSPLIEFPNGTSGARINNYSQHINQSVRCPECGNQLVDIFEECDDGNQNNNDNCRNDCTLPFCPDGIVDFGEQCDDGNLNNLDNCRNNCILPFCGDGIFDAGEECDDSNNINGDGCSSQCVIEFCGDNSTQPLLNEQCDYGLFNTNVPCVPGYGINCTYCDLNCALHQVNGEFCGDGIKNGPEDCDGNDLGGETCQSLGHVPGTLSCDPDCNFDFDDCRVTKEPIKDSKVAKAQPTANFGLGRYMMVNDKLWGTDRSYLGFDLSNSGLGSVSNADLEVHVYQTGSQVLGSVIEAWYCYNLDFNELTINWNNQFPKWKTNGVLLSGNCTLADGYTVVNKVNSGLPETKHTWDLTAEVNQALSSKKKFTVVLKHDTEDKSNNYRYVQYLTKDYSEASYRPHLVLS